MCDHHTPSDSLGPFWAVVAALFLGVAFGAYLKAGDMRESCDATGRYTLEGKVYHCFPKHEKKL